MGGRDGWRRYYCPVCGHVEWVPPGDELPADYHCPLCEAKRKAMVLVDDTLGARHGIALEPIAAGVCRIRKRPPYRADFEHFAYALQHPEGLVLFDAPHVPSAEAVTAVRALGQPRALILALYWSGAPDGPVLLAGDALTVWRHVDGRVQLAFLQNPPASAEARALAQLPVALLCTCTGTLAGAEEPLRRLLASAEPCARPYLADPGGVWLAGADERLS